MTNKTPKKKTTPFARAKKHYTLFMVLLTLVVVFAFLEPTLKRLLEGSWTRGKFNYVWTLSLDVHALMGYGFLLLFCVQYALGFFPPKKPSWRGAHKLFGRLILFVFIPAFAIANIWLVMERSSTIPSESSVIFRQYRPMIRFIMYQLLGFFLFFLARSYWAIRKRDVLLHVDSIVLAYTFAAAVAIMRLFYFLFWLIRGGSPFSLPGMYFLSAAFVLLLFLVLFSLVGRLKENKYPLVAIFVFNVLMAILGSSYYSFWDLPKT